MALLVLVAAHLILLGNALLHPSSIGYDAPGHLQNIVSLSRFTLPFDSPEFYSPPLPYFLPAMLLRLGVPHAAKIFQLQNVACSLGIFLLLRRRGFWTLFLLALMPVYYRSFAMVRGEPMLAFFAVLSAELYLKAAAGTSRSLKPWIRLGLSLGAMILCRQWAFLMFPAFERKLDVGAVARAPYSRYLEAGLSDLWKDPVWYYRFNRPLTGLYADFWTDSFSYFLVYGRDAKTGTYLSGNELDARIESLPLSGKPLDFESNRYSARGYFKATYLLQICPFLALLGGGFLERLKKKRAAVAILMIAGLHDLPLLATRYRKGAPSPEKWGVYRRLGRSSRPGAVSEVSAGGPPPRGRDLVDRGIARFSAGDAAGAERDFIEAVRLRQRSGDAYASLVAVQAARERFPEAGRTLEEAEGSLKGSVLEEFQLRTMDSRRLVMEEVLGPKL